MYIPYCNNLEKYLFLKLNNFFLMPNYIKEVLRHILQGKHITTFPPTNKISVQIILK